ncbi:MAG: hypothetical protein ACI8QF_001139, partial [Limisphaerales bacterium]
MNRSLIACLTFAIALTANSAAPIDIGSQRELF